MGPFSSVVLMLSSDAGCLTNPHSYFAVAGEQAGQGRWGRPFPDKGCCENIKARGWPSGGGVACGQ